MRATSEGGAERPLILICNDDGITAPGIIALASAVQDLGLVYVVAPASEQSAVGHAITVRQPVRAHEWIMPGEMNLAGAFAVSGTPADSIKLAVNRLLPRKPDLVLSGINRGPNTAVNVIYSGTVSAATEASILGVGAVALSLCDWGASDYETAGRIARRVALQVLSDGLPPGILLNVNIPYIPYDEIRGIQITRQARSRWEESFGERRDPFDQPYFWLTGRFVNLDEGENTDLAAVESGYVSISPLHHDLTAYEYMRELHEQAWELAPDSGGERPASGEGAGEGEEEGEDQATGAAGSSSNH